VADGEPGDLYIQGPSAAMMYWGNRHEDARDLPGRLDESGDKYVRNDDGSYTYSGRTDDMLKVSGVYVSPFEIEATLVQHPAVLEAAVIASSMADGSHQDQGLRGAEGGRHGHRAELKAFVKDKLAPYKYPRYIEFVDDLPKTATGKIQRFKLRERERAARRSASLSDRIVTHSSVPWRDRAYDRASLARRRCGGAGAARRVPARGARLGVDVARFSGEALCAAAGRAASSIRGRDTAARRHARGDEAWDTRLHAPPGARGPAGAC
jgi:hypothetical protein